MIPPGLLTASVTLEVYQGTGALGDVFGAPVQVPCYIEGSRRLVRNAAGDEVVSEETIYCDPDANYPDGYPAGSRVTVRGRKTEVITTSVFDDGGITGLAHQEVAVA